MLARPVFAKVDGFLEKFGKGGGENYNSAQQGYEYK